MAALDEHIAFSVFRLLVMVVSLVGNAVTLFVIVSYEKIRGQGANILFAQLAVADFILGIGAGARGVSTIVFHQFGLTSHRKGLCLALGSPTVFGIHLSQTTMVTIAFDRFLCVRFPIFYRHLECSHFLLLRCALCVFYSSLGTAASYLGVAFEAEVEICSTGTAITSWYSVYWLIFSTVLTIVIYIAYIAIFVLFRRQSSAAFGKSTTQKALFATTTAVLVSYFVCWCIRNVLFVVFKQTDSSKTLIGYVGVLTGVGGALSSTTNIFIYGWKHPDMRCQLKKILGGLTGTTSVGAVNVQLQDVTVK
ncbi:hypothetical protein QR680_008627 [Steinernema hermaphroditum]|uniref:G-protein coupled receptors family 1 profile domain-containing protein n=1 Tax=Steinernema hermaphroditum TaxID=289476 RepID=A0AA39M7C5_9BILA|nr:hypothetical protein QR680_008627 [Steinernema hermaphroditum]